MQIELLTALGILLYICSKKLQSHPVHLPMVGENHEDESRCKPLQSMVHTKMQRAKLLANPAKMHMLLNEHNNVHL